MKLRYTILYVENVETTLSFYERSFGLTRAMLHESGDYGELDTGSTKLAFSSASLMTQLGRNPGKPDVNNPVFEIAFETDDVEASLQAALKQGATLIQEVRNEPWGQTTAYVGDPNGFLIEICSPVAS
ncbi:VOC family protein [Reinekea sp. G2M2-21]|uniref:VOC family protein n=1 Tax=Reinekea sp. G2M2-21 TaxID=2788942 RepID=UPI0018A9F07D|nr:VOC family protein [Reinekea sp. G2M2-21]